GSFSERFANLVRTCGKECIRLDVPLGCAVEPDMLREALRRSPVDAVTMVHSETSTGVLQDVAALAAVVREFDDVLVLVDAVTSLAGSPVETDAWGFDFVFTGSQKALALPPGLPLGVAFLPREGRRSWTVSCLRLPEGKSAKQLIGALKEQGWVIGSGYGALKDTTIRIGHMGDHTVEGLNRLLPLVGLQLA